MSGTETAERPARKKAVVRVAPEDLLGDLQQPVRRAVAPALEVGGVHDAAEHEADRLADRVVARLRAQESGEAADDAGGVHAHHGHEPGVAHRSPAPAPAVPVTVGREGGSAGPELTSTIESMRGGGRALDAGVRRSMGEAFGRDLSGVRVHTDGRAAAAAAQMGAVAFTTGRDIFFGAGQYRPDTDAGRHVLAHELAHTVQQEGSTRRKVSRLWDFSRKGKLPLHSTKTIFSLEKRPVWIFEDQDGDQMVVKREKDLIGLGELVGAMQARLNGVSTVDYYKMSSSERGYAEDLMDFDFIVDYPSWAKRGRFVKSMDDTGSLPDDEVEAARQVVHDELRQTRQPLVAMSFAQGTSGEDLAAAPDKDSGTALRAMLSKPGHLKKLGALTAVDLFMGNQDRVLRGNLGNWFYNPDGAMTVIDNVDGGSGMSAEWRSGSVADAAIMKLRMKEIGNTALEAVDYLRMGMQDNGDDDAKSWMDEVLPSGLTRKQTFASELLAGMIEQRAKLLKIFTATRFTVGGSKDRKTKKALKASAATANAVDADDNGTDYYTMMKQRAAYLKKN